MSMQGVSVNRRKSPLAIAEWIEIGRRIMMDIEKAVSASDSGVD